MRSINNSIDTPSIKLKMNPKDRVDEMKTTKTIKKQNVSQKKQFFWEFYAYVSFAIVLEIIVLVINNSLKILNISRITIFSLLLLLALLYMKKIQENVLLSLICFIKIFQTTTIFLNDEVNLLVLLPFAYEEIDMNIKQNSKFKVFEKILIKLIGLGLVSFFNKIPLAVAINSFLLLLELTRAKFLKKNQKSPQQNLIQKQMIEEDQIINSKSPDSEKHLKEDIWKKRFYAIPISILMISKQTLKITYKNQNLFKQFCDSFINEDELEDLIMNKLYFSFMSDHQEIIQLSSTNIIKLKQKKSNSLNVNQLKSSITQISSFDLMQKRTLKEILASISHGINGIDKEFIELFCQQTEISGAKYQLEGKIILAGEDDEFFIIINDISKQNEIQQFIVKEEFKSKIIQSFSHELRTPLNSAINFLEASIISNSFVDEKLKLEAIEPALNSLKLQSYLIDDILDYQKYSAGQLELSITEFSIQDLLGQITSLFSIQFHLKKIAYNINLVKNQLQYFSSDQQRITQIIVNLLQNALKYTTGGVIKIKLASIQNDIMKVVISDTGVGMDSKKLEQIKVTLKNVEESKDFQTFKVWDGFGLLIVALLHQSLCPPNYKSIQIESTLKKGTKIKVYFMNFNYSSKQNTIKHSLSGKNTIKSMSVKRSFESSSLSQIMPMNGTLYIAQDLGQVSYHMKKSEKLLNSPSNTIEEFSEFSKSPKQQYSTPDNNISNITKLIPHEPKLISNIKSSQQKNNSKAQLLQSSKSSKSQLVNLNQFRKFETLYREDIYRKIVTLQNKCNCKVIMSVDDEIFNQKSVQRLLQQIGFEVKLAFSGDEAIQLVKSLNPCSLGCCLLTVILMDYQMPIKDGIATTKELIKLMNEGAIPEIPIVGLTAFTGQQEVRNCFIAGMTNVLSKPLKIQELKDVLASI